MYYIYYSYRPGSYGRWSCIIYAMGRVPTGDGHVLNLILAGVPAGDGHVLYMLWAGFLQEMVINYIYYLYRPDSYGRWSCIIYTMGRVPTGDGYILYILLV